MIRLVFQGAALIAGGFLAVLVLAGHGQPGTAPAAVEDRNVLVARSAECRWATGPIELDGKLDEAAWGKAQVIKDFAVFWEKRTPKKATGGKPNPGAKWRFAFCRYDYSVGFDRAELSSTAPLTRSDFHRYEDYGELTFVGSAN